MPHYRNWLWLAITLLASIQTILAIPLNSSASTPYAIQAWHDNPPDPWTIEHTDGWNQYVFNASAYKPTWVPYNMVREYLQDCLGEVLTAEPSDALGFGTDQFRCKIFSSNSIMWLQRMSGGTMGSQDHIWVKAIRATINWAQLWKDSGFVPTATLMIVETGRQQSTWTGSLGHKGTHYIGEGYNSTSAAVTVSNKTDVNAAVPSAYSIVEVS